MPTHTIGRGKVNITTTFDLQDARQLGRVAYILGKSRNEWMREVILEAIRQAQAAGRICIKTGRSMILVLSFGAVLYAIAQGENMRRVNSTVRLARRRWEEAA